MREERQKYIPSFLCDGMVSEPKRGLVLGEADVEIRVFDEFNLGRVNGEVCLRIAEM